MNSCCTIISMSFIVVVVIVTSSNSEHCLFRYPKDFRDEEPVLIWNQSLLILPEKDVIVLKEGAKIMLACPGRSNSLIKTGEKFAIAACVSGITVAVGGVNYEISELVCSSSVFGELQATTIKCAASRGVVKLIGFFVNNKFLTLFDVCYNDNTGEALYADHGIIGSAIAFAKPENMSTCFNEGGLATGVNTGNYRPKAQLKLFIDLLGSAELAHNYITANSYLEAAHLIPHADQMYVSYAFSTYFYIITVPQWQQIKNGNWESLEFNIRNFASISREDFQVITGGWGVLQLEDVNGNLVDIYLSGDKLPVPKFVWKVVISMNTKKAIAFVIVNNPFLYEVTEDDYICNNICDKYNWGSTDWSVITKGLLYCCDVKELRKTVNTIPNFNVDDVLEGISTERRAAMKTCTLNYKKDFPFKESVLLWNYNSLITPQNEAIVLNGGDEIIVACPGSRNSLLKTGTQFTSAKCVRDQIFKVRNIKYLFSNLNCTTSVTGEFQSTSKTCGASRGVIKHIGYYVNELFLTLFDICYDNNGETLYADHVIFGSAIAYSKSLKTRPSFKVGGLASGVNAGTAYKQITQRKTFADLLGSADLANRYIYSNSYLARGHLAPDADFVYGTSSSSTYFYMNTVPQWQRINNGNWKSLEYSIRSVASSSKENLRVITGGWDVLQLEDINGNLVDIYLSGDKLPVPKFVWKVVYSLQTQKGIAFVSVNNPFLEEVSEDDYICTNICDTYNWGSKTWYNPSKGLLYCCDVDELRKIIVTIPYFHIENILEGFSARKILRKLFEM